MITILKIYKNVDTCVISTTAVCAFPDLAIGAPYGGEEGRGVVYIYVGSMDGIITEVSQVLQGKDMGYQLSTFGFSISGGHDLDQNGYPGKIDLLMLFDVSSRLFYCYGEVINDHFQPKSCMYK